MRPPLILIAILLAYSSLAQDGVGIGTTTVPADAVLNISSTSKGVLFPQVDATTRASLSPASDGLMVYDPDTKQYYYYDGGESAWKRLVEENSFGTVPLGGIIMWSGNSTNVPDGYVLCDGVGTYHGHDVPDLMDRFLIGGTNPQVRDRVPVDQNLSSDYATGGDCSEYEFLWSFTIRIIYPPAGEDPYDPLSLCNEQAASGYSEDFTDIPGNSCEEAAEEVDMPGNCYEEVINCSSISNPDYYLGNPDCQVAGVFYEIAFIMRVE